MTEPLDVIKTRTQGIAPDHGDQRAGQWGRRAMKAGQFDRAATGRPTIG